MRCILFLLLMVIVFSSCQSPNSRTDQQTQQERLNPEIVQINMKTQTWFGVPEDNELVPFQTENTISSKGYFHWSIDSGEPSEENIGVEFMFLPEMYESYGAKLKVAGDYKNIDGTPARFFSSLDPAVIRADIDNMKRAGVKTVTPQVFLNGSSGDLERDFALIRMYLQYAGEAGLSCKIEVDITGLNDETLTGKLKEFWLELNHRIEINRTCWEKINAKPVLALWGIGFIDRPGSRDQAIELINWFKNGTDNPVKVWLVGGIPFYWNKEISDCKVGFRDVFLMFDTVTPWSIGRFNAATFDVHKDMIRKQVELCAANNVIYKPVMWAGFSWHNRKSNENSQNRLIMGDNTVPYFVPRENGSLLWKQFRFYKELRLVCFSYAMWNEDDEGTALFSHQTDSHKLPKDILIPDKGATSPDFYIRLLAEINQNYILENSVSRVPANVPVPLK